MLNDVWNKYRQARLLVYLSMVIGLGYTFYKSAKIHGITTTWIVSLILAISLSIIFIEVIIRLFIKYFNKTK